MTTDHAFTARISTDDYMELNTGTGHVYEFAMRHLKESSNRTAWLNHLREKNWFTEAHEDEMTRLINRRFNKQEA
jgi:hypothetical protein